MTSTKRMQHVIPAIIPRSFAYLEEVAEQLRDISELQLDLVADPFVSEPSWPYNTAAPMPAEVERTEALCARHIVEVDLMVADPLAAAQVWLAAGAKKLVVHIETMHTLEDFLALKNHFDFSLGLSLNNDTSLEELVPHIPSIDYVQCMGIAEIGSQGQPFDDRVLDRVRELTERYPGLLVSVDGSVNPTTIPALYEAGVGRFVIGSAIVKQPDPQAAYETITTQVTELAQ